MPRNEDYKSDLIADLRNDLGYAAEYLSAAYADSQEAFLVALRDVAEAQQGMAKVASQAKVNRESLYRTLSREGNPRLSTLNSVLNALGLKIAIVEQEYAATTPAPVNIQRALEETRADGSKENTLFGMDRERNKRVKSLQRACASSPKER